MPDRIEELFEELAESANNEDYITFPGGRQIRKKHKLLGDIYSSLAGFGDELTQAGRVGREWQDIENERLVEGLYKNDPAVLAALGTLATLPVSLPVQAPAWLTRAGVASKVPGAEKLYGKVGQDFTKFIDPIKSKVSGIFGRSGSGVGADVVGRTPLPKVKDPVVTKRGPRGPINIDSPKQIPLKGLEDARYTKGLSETDRVMIERIIPPLTKTGQKGIPSTTPGKSTKSYMDTVRQTKQIEQQTNRLKFLEHKLRLDQARMKVGEAPSKDFYKMLEEVARLKELLKKVLIPPLTPK
jgi:hypothetical protein